MCNNYNYATNEEKFTNAELKGRNYFYQNVSNSPHVDSYYFTGDRYEHYDACYHTTTNKKYMVEIKYRDNYSSTSPLIQNEGILIEKYKYDNLINAIKTDRSSYLGSDEKIPLYITYFNDGKGYIYTINEDDKIEWYEKKCPQNTVNNGKYITKIVGNIPLNKCKEIKYNKEDADNKQNTYNYIITK